MIRGGAKTTHPKYENNVLFARGGKGIPESINDRPTHGGAGRFVSYVIGRMKSRFRDRRAKREWPERSRVREISGASRVEKGRKRRVRVAPNYGSRGVAQRRRGRRRGVVPLSGGREVGYRSIFSKVRHRSADNVSDTA